MKTKILSSQPTSINASRFTDDHVASQYVNDLCILNDMYAIRRWLRITPEDFVVKLLTCFVQHFGAKESCQTFPFPT